MIQGQVNRQKVVSRIVPVSQCPSSPEWRLMTIPSWATQTQRGSSALTHDDMHSSQRKSDCDCVLLFL